jgi:hypothetical protein
LNPIAIVGGVVVAVALLIGLTWLFTANDIALTHYAQPQYEAIRRETFEQSKAYNQGMIQNLHTMQMSYVQADDAHKAALAQIILHEAADYDVNSLPPDLRTFVQNLQKQAVGG